MHKMIDWSQLGHCNTRVKSYGNERLKRCVFRQLRMTKVKAQTWRAVIDRNTRSGDRKRSAAAGWPWESSDFVTLIFDILAPNWHE